MQVLIGFVSGVLVTLVGAVISSQLERRRRRTEELEKARFEIYMRLMEINSLYFYVTAAEFHGEKAPDDLRRNIRSKTWSLLDKLRETDQVEHLDEIMEVLLSDGIETARERADRMDSLLDSLGGKVNPRYKKAIRRVDQINQRKMLENPTRHSNAPGATFPT